MDVPCAAQQMAEEAKRGPQRSAAPGHQGAAARLSPASRREPVWPEVGLGPSLPQPRATWPGWRGDGARRRRRRNAGKQQDGAAGEGRVERALGAPSVRKGGVEGPVRVLPAGRSRLPPAWEAAWTGSGCGRRRAHHETPLAGIQDSHRAIAAPFLNLHSPVCLSPLGVLVLLGERLDQGEAKSEQGKRRLIVDPRGHPRGLEMEPAGKWTAPHPYPYPPRGTSGPSRCRGGQCGRIQTCLFGFCKKKKEKKNLFLYVLKRRD